MTYIPKIKQRALELLREGYSPEIVSDKLSKEFSKEDKIPTGKTVRIWRIEARKLDKEQAEFKQTAEEFRKTHPEIRWLQNL